MRIEPLTPDSVPEITRVAKHAFEFDEIDEALIREKTVGAEDFDPELSFVVKVEGRVVGFAQGAVGVGDDDRGIGYVRLLAVSPAWRRRRVGTLLLFALESQLQARNCHTISIMDCPQNYFQPGLDFRYTEGVCFLLRHGYRMVDENHNMRCDIDVGQWLDLEAEIKRLSAEGFVVRRAEFADEPQLCEFLQRHWPAWVAEVKRALRRNPPSVHLACHGGKIVAFAAYQGNNSSLSWFGPMGTDPEVRKKGLGAILLRLCLLDLAHQGWRHAIIPWVGPISFYARTCGAWLDRCFWVYRKDFSTKHLEWRLAEAALVEESDRMSKLLQAFSFDPMTRKEPELVNK